MGMNCDRIYTNIEVCTQPVGAYMSVNLFDFKLISLSVLLMSLISGSPIQAETCRGLKVIGGEGTSVRKTVSPISTLITRNNWNTDFAVPGGRAFNRYVVTILPENNANYDIKLNFKYSDNTAIEFFNQNNVAVRAKKPFKITAEPPTQSDPFQVNVFVGGISAIGNTYTVSVLACQ